MCNRGAVSHPILPMAALLRPRIPRGELVYNKDFAWGAEAHVWLPLHRKWWNGIKLEVRVGHTDEGWRTALLNPPWPELHIAFVVSGSCRMPGNLRNVRFRVVSILELKDFLQKRLQENLALIGASICDVCSGLCEQGQLAKVNSQGNQCSRCKHTDHRNHKHSGRQSGIQGHSHSMICLHLSVFWCFLKEMTRASNPPSLNRLIVSYVSCLP